MPCYGWTWCEPYPTRAKHHHCRASPGRPTDDRVYHPNAGDYDGAGDLSHHAAAAHTEPHRGYESQRPLEDESGWHRSDPPNHGWHWSRLLSQRDVSIPLVKRLTRWPSVRVGDRERQCANPGAADRVADRGRCFSLCDRFDHVREGGDRGLDHHVGLW